MNRRTARTVDPVIEHLRRTAKAVVAERDDVECIVLFGSRARGSHRTDSDYDVALLTVAGAARGFPCRDLVAIGVERTFPGVVVDAWAFDAHRLEAEGHLLGTLAHELREDGLPLAGQWNAQEFKAMAKTIKTQGKEIKRHLGQMAQNIKEAGTSRADVGGGVDAEDADPKYQYALQMAAEHWAKAVLIVLGIRPISVHSMVQLSDKLRNDAAGDDERLEWSKRIARLNGSSHFRHVVIYEEDTMEPLPDADKRFIITMETIGQWLESGQLVHRATDDERVERGDMLRDVAGKFLRAIGKVRRYDLFPTLPEEVVRSLDTLDQRCASLLEQPPQGDAPNGGLTG